MTSAITRKVMDATEMEPTYKKVKTQVSSLGLYLLLEQVCTKNSVNNVEMLRIKLIDHHYVDSDCIYAFITELDSLFRFIDLANRYNAEQKNHGKKPIIHNTPRGGDSGDSSRDYRGRSYRVAREEAEIAEEAEGPVRMDGNYLSSGYSGGRCSVATCYVEADGTGVDYGNTPDTSPVREEQESDMMVEDCEIQEEEIVESETILPELEVIPAPPSAQSTAHAQSPHRINVSVQGGQGVNGYTIAELETALAQRREVQQQSN
ncbi:hypothetical protein B484DRAFT_432311 [Ochromonadaceae sp. CCMP2298]|nr:hypothetical protein B484DRAFT_432311 [Ochromonadaceae sp. CCMP2298]